MPVVAVDGPSGSGKSSVSREVARQLGLRYLDTGAMYRAVTWSALQAGIDLTNADAVCAHARAFPLTMPTDPDDVRLVLRGTDVTEAIRSHEITSAVSTVATNLCVRAELRDQQRAVIAKAVADGGIVVEGRDITTVVAPDADVRILLTASEESRLARRARQVLGSDAGESIEAVRDVVLLRDVHDATVSSFRTAADGVIEIDSSAMSFEQTVQTVLDVVAAAGDAKLADDSAEKLDEVAHDHA